MIRRIINKLGIFKTGTTFLSYKKPLKLLCKNFQFSKILEFGPGKSE